MKKIPPHWTYPPRTILAMGSTNKCCLPCCPFAWDSIIGFATEKAFASYARSPTDETATFASHSVFVAFYASAYVSTIARKRVLQLDQLALELIHKRVLVQLLLPA